MRTRPRRCRPPPRYQAHTAAQPGVSVGVPSSMRRAARLTWAARAGPGLAASAEEQEPQQGLGGGR